ncbi:carboxymuconolactone decarboxylase family protein [Actinoplanes sp. TBRC 11911]|uniref:carboxymuconolactone decarboxylase family protein n=1 Tax=Actinoplanes sp. TBRC 11911 TaxID=2729386 RepID=UPI00145EB7E0|nr:carboxymuconolactone decarboxylase family protein [Actinoplanes sp. TBRC 11911]NMO56248.1 carboxymuconolactone decarboxylase family protein [Actinoplanes sp. TBRC 11911]
MTHIDLGVDEERLPGIQGLLAYRPETAKPLMDLAEVLLRSPNSLPRGERELIAAYVSSRNENTYCRESHSAFAAAQLPSGRQLVDEVRQDPETAAISQKLRTLLHIAEAVRRDGRTVTDKLVEAARSEGATDREIHDTVLIAAAFSMFNRYVDGLATASPSDPEAYQRAVPRSVNSGYTAR